MNRETVEVFHGLMKHGWIDRREDPLLWSYVQETDVQEELEDFKSVMGFDLVSAGNRLYMVPTQDNDLFLKDNSDYRIDTKLYSTIRNRDLYLMNYLAIYLIYVFFKKEGISPLARDLISKEAFIDLFTKHCKQAGAEDLSGSENAPDYSENFVQLAQAWMSKLDGEPDSQKFDCRYGVLNRLLLKFKTDGIFDVDDENIIRPTRKLIDLMPYFLRKDRIAEIQNWIREEDCHAENQ